MRSCSSSASFHAFSFPAVVRSPKPSFLSSLPATPRVSFESALRRRHSSCFRIKPLEPNVRKNGLRRRVLQVTAMDEGISFDEWGDNDGAAQYMNLSSDGEDSDGEILLNPISDVDLPIAGEQSLITNDALTVTAHRLGMLGRGYKRSRIKYGIINNIGLITFLTMLVLFVDWCAWRIVRLPLKPFYLMRPFCISAVLVSCAGYVCVPALHSLNICSIIRKRGPARHISKKRTPTMGGLFFVPIGIIVAEVMVGFSSTEVSGVAAATVAFAAIGLLADILNLIKNHTNGLSAWMRILLEVAIGAWFSFWLDNTNVSSPYSMYTFL